MRSEHQLVEAIRNLGLFLDQRCIGIGVEADYFNVDESPTFDEELSQQRRDGPKMSWIVVKCACSYLDAFWVGSFNQKQPICDEGAARLFQELQEVVQLKVFDKVKDRDRAKGSIGKVSQVSESVGVSGFEPPTFAGIDSARVPVDAIGVDTTLAQ